MKISIITPTFNSERVISRNIESVIAQKYIQFEHIVIDNLSSDGTLNIIADIYNNAGLNDKLKIVSEKDNGISDAFNKGINSSSGEIVTILNSDDFYTGNYVLDKVIDAFANKNILFTHGNIFFYDPYYGSNVRKPLLCHITEALPYNHPTMFFRREVYEKYGLYDIEYKYAMDFEYICRLTKKIENLDKYSAYLDGGALVQMESGGASWENELKSIDETKKALKKYDLWNFNARKNYNLRVLRTKLKVYLSKIGLSGIVKKWRKMKWEN